MTQIDSLARLALKYKENNMGNVIGGILFWIVLIGSVYLIVSSEENELKKVEQLVNNKNIELSTQQFEIKEIFTQKHGNKNTNFYISYQCIVENVNNKSRLIVLFDNQHIPVVGDIWQIQTNEYMSHNNQFRYKLYQKIK